MSNGKRPEGGKGKRSAGDKAQAPRSPLPKGGKGAKPTPSRESGAAASPARPAQAARETGATSGIAVVALGGSAGSLDCFKAFFDAMPSDSGAAFVVIQHLAPAHESLLPELLSQHTRMTVAQAADETPVQANCVYVIPPNRDLAIRDGILHLTETVRHGNIHMPIDFFLRSLAEDRQERAVCVLLSRAGSDGTLGVRAIRGAGGLTIAQDPRTAQYGDMPRSAIATRLVDYVISPDQMPQAITEYLRQPYVRGGEPADVLAAEGRPGGFDEILATVQKQTSCDFRCYKKSTILRRIERRMGLRHVSDIGEYGKALRHDANEIAELFKDLLINVTAFFRDADAFEELRGLAIAPLVQSRQGDDPLRVWVPGCASGEEAYSLAMLLMEEITAARKICPIQVFATDIDEESLAFGRKGTYPASIVADVGPERLAKFFVMKEHGYQVCEALRNSVVFATQNLIADPPFSKMDLISCRNLLIYLDGETQAKLVPLFNFALNAGGYLFLGKSEGVGSQSDLFSAVSKKARLYRRITPGRPVVLDTPILPGRRRAAFTAAPPVKPGTSYADAIRQALLGHFAAGVVLVDHKGQILQFHGQTAKYLDMPTGEPNLNLLDIAKEGLSSRLRSALHAAINEGKPVVLEHLPITRQEGSPFVRVTVMPLARRGPARSAGPGQASPPLEAEGLLTVIFEDVPRPAIVAEEPPPGAGSDVAVRQLENELRDTQQDLQSSIEELQSANEELRVSNEEVVSTNEELQSTNEELETSKEELQSVNEELTTVNSQLQDRVERLAVANRDMANLLKSTRIATLFLDGELRIKLFTPSVTRVLKMIPSDTGRPISDLSAGFIDYDLTAGVRAVAKGGPIIERDVHHADGSCFLVRIMPYLAEEDRPEGVVVTFDDVTRLRRAEEHTRRLATVVTDSNDAVVLFDLEGQIQAWNRGAGALYGWTEEEALRMNVRDLAPAEDAAAAGELTGRLAEGGALASFETKRRAKDGRVLDVWLTATAVRDESGKVVAIATTERDITGRKRQEAAILRAKEEWERTFNNVPDLIVIVDDRHRVVRANLAMAQRLGLTPEQCVGVPCYKAVHGTDAPPDFCPHAQSLLDGRQHEAEVHEERLGGDFLVTTPPLLDSEGKMTGSVHVARDITESAQARREREITVELLRLVNEAKGTAELVRAAATFFHERSGCEAVGIRLKEGDDYPYHEAHGFGEEFVRMENSLCARDDAGKPIRDGAGNPLLECMCGNVIQGRFDPSKPFFTARGSFWTNCTTELLAATSDADRQARTRNRCNGQGYESVALIALRVGEERLGLIQLNDKRKDRFTPATIALWERLADYLAIALAKTRTDDALRDAHDHMSWLASLPEENPNPVVRVGADGTVLYRNLPAAHLSGWSCEEGKPLPEPLERLVREAMDSGRPLQQDMEISGRSYLVWVAPIVEQCYANLYSRDVTDRRQAEEDLRKKAEELARSNAELEQFAYVASHDLQEPLRMVSAFLRLLDERYRPQLDDKAREFIGYAVEGSTRMSQLIIDLLEYSRVATKAQPPMPVDANGPLDAALANLRGSIQEAGAAVTHEELPTVTADGTQLTQLFQNLIGNAVKFCHPDRPCQVHVSASRQKDEWVFAVRDNGIGMVKQSYDRVFDIFQRLHTRDKYPGTGIGLAICKKIVERHGGRIWVDSKPGEGSTFCFTLPAPGTDDSPKSQ